MKREIPGFDAYEITDAGEVFRNRDGMRLSPTRTTSGYLRFNLYADRKRHSITAHSLVLLTFGGPRPPGMHIAHLNGDRTDNRLANLVYATPHANEAMKRSHGTSPQGERHGSAKLTEEVVAMVRALPRDRRGRIVGMFTIAKRIGVDPVTLRRAITGKSWGHITERKESA